MKRNRNRPRPQTSRPLKIGLYDMLGSLPQHIRDEIEELRTAEQRNWQDALSNLLAGQGIPSDVARYAALHSLEVSTATDKAKKILKILKEMQSY